MITIHTIAFYLHVVVGSAALLLFWIPMTARKGQFNHRYFGGFYNKAMYIVAITGALMALLVLWDPMVIHGHRLSNLDNQARFETQMRVFYSLLLYLSLLVYTGLEQGILALQCKTSTKPLARPQVILGNGLMVLSAPLLFWAGWQFEQTLPKVFAILGLLSGLSNLRFISTRQPIGNRWLKEHIGAQISTAIGAYTAFLAFGGRALLSNIGEWQLAFWMAPGVIGALVIRHFTLKYANPKTQQLNKG